MSCCCNQSASSSYYGGQKDWFPPPANQVPCCVLLSGWKPTLRCCPTPERYSDYYCCISSIPTELEVRATQIAFMNNYMNQRAANAIRY